MKGAIIMSLKHRSGEVSFCLSRPEILYFIHVLDFYVRIGLGQFIVIDQELFLTEDEKRSALLQELREAMIPSLNFYPYRNCSLGIFQEETPVMVKNVYSILGRVRHDFSWFEHPEGDHLSFWFDEPSIRGDISDVKTLCERDKTGRIKMWMLHLDPGQQKAVYDAAHVMDDLTRLNIARMFRRYSKDATVTALAKQLEILYREAVPLPDEEKKKELKKKHTALNFWIRGTRSQTDW